MPEQEKTSETTAVFYGKKMYAYATFVVLILIVLGSGFYSFIQRNAGAPIPETEVPITQQDWAKSVRETDAYKNAIAERNTGNFDGAMETLEALKKEMETMEERSVVDMDIAGTLFRKDPIAGAERYAQIAADESYPRLTRGTAFLMMYLQYSGTGNVGYIRPFFTQEEYNEFGKNNTLAYESARRIHALFPFVTAGSVLAKVELREFDPGFPNTKTVPDERLNGEAQRIYEKYFALFDSNIAFFERSEGMRQYIPNTYLSHAKFVGELASAGYVLRTIDVTTHAKELYEEGLTRARAQSAAITEQFIMSKYAEFLFSVEQNDEAAKIVRSLSEQTLTPMFAQYLTTVGASNEIPFFFGYLNTNPDVAKQFGIQ